MSMYCYFNGEIQQEEKVNIGIHNRSFKYGDGLFETLRIYQGKLLFVDMHYERLISSARLMKYDLSDMILTEELVSVAQKLCSENKVLNGRMRIHIYRKGKGLYTPDNNRIGILIEVNPLSSGALYALDKKGLNVGLYSEVPLIKSIVPGKTASSMIYVLASLYRKENGLDDVLLINNKGEIVEGGSSNIFAVKGDVIYTPSLEQVGIQGVFRRVIYDFISQQNKWKLQETNIYSADLAMMDGVFLTNVISGIRWIHSCKENQWDKEAVNIFYQELIKYIYDKI